MFKSIKSVASLGPRITNPNTPCILHPYGARFYSIKSKGREFNRYLDRIGDEKTKESQNTLKFVRILGAGTVIMVVCSLLWASAVSAPVTEKLVEVPDLTTDVRDKQWSER